MVTFKPRTRLPGSVRYDRIKDLEQAAIQLGIDSDRVILNCNTKRTGTQFAYTTEAAVREGNLMLRNYEFYPSCPLIVLPIETGGLEVTAVPAQGTRHDIENIEDVLVSLENVGKFADLLSTNDWTLLRPK